MANVIDPVADMLTRVRNAQKAYHTQVKIPVSKMKVAVAGILKEEGYITEVEISESDIVIDLKYIDGKGVISGMNKLSKPGRRLYVGVADIPSVQNGLGICILSTSKGVLEGAAARTANIGGELLCEIW
ncbi:MAG: 30S ribosomal protein S8 [Desulfovibrio sp.]